MVVCADIPHQECLFKASHAKKFEGKDEVENMYRKEAAQETENRIR